MLAVKITDADYNRLGGFVESELGIKMPPSKKTLVESRLQKRLRLLGLGSFSEYCDYIFADAGKDELIHTIDLITTNKTDFFREPAHFDYLFKAALPELVRTGAGISRPLKIWSAGCSTGEEPYTLAMVLSEFARLNSSVGLDYSILASDISTRVLETARRGIYAADRVAPVADSLRKKYLLKSRDKARGLVRITPELRNRVRFSRVNFMSDDFGFRESFDIIFCRNVVIYFDKRTQEGLFGRFCDSLHRGGYLFIGHSETLNGFDLPLVKSAQSVFRKTGPGL